MAEQYQLPPQFQAPSMAEVSYQAGDSQAADNANFALFTDQINKYTNIQNANRDISLREKQFQNLVVQNDRDYVLRREKQDQDIRNGDITYEINKFNFDRNRENYNQLQEAWGQREKWVEGIDNLMPSGGNSPTYLRDKARAFRLFAKNPSSYAVLNELFKPYDDQYRVYQANKSLEDEAEVQSAFESGLLDNEKIGDQDATAYFRDIILNREADPVSYAAGMRNLKRIAGIAQEDVARRRQVLLDAETKGRFEAEAFGAGATDVELTMEGGKIVRKAKTPRVFAPARTGTSATSGGVKTFEKADVEFLDNQIKSVETEITTKEGELEAAESQVAKAGIQAEVDGLKAKKQSLQKTMDMGVQLLQQKAASQLPQATDQPQATPGRVTPQKILKAPSFPVPAGTPRQPATTPANPMSSTPTTTGEAVIGYVNEEGMRLTEAEAKAQQAAGRRVYPIRPPAVANPFGAPVTSEGIKASVSG